MVRPLYNSWKEKNNGHTTLQLVWQGVGVARASWSLVSTMGPRIELTGQNMFVLLIPSAEEWQKIMFCYLAETRMKCTLIDSNMPILHGSGNHFAIGHANMRDMTWKSGVPQSGRNKAYDFWAQYIIPRSNIWMRIYDVFRTEFSCSDPLLCMYTRVVRF